MVYRQHQDPAEGGRPHRGCAGFRIGSIQKTRLRRDFWFPKHENSWGYSRSLDSPTDPGVSHIFVLFLHLIGSLNCTPSKERGVEKKQGLTLSGALCEVWAGIICKPAAA